MSGPLAAPVTRAFRKILSGSPDGRPDWVQALEEPGDVGWFGPGRAIWAVHGSLATLVGGVRALLHVDQIVGACLQQNGP